MMLCVCALPVSCGFLFPPFSQYNNNKTTPTKQQKRNNTQTHQQLHHRQQPMRRGNIQRCLAERSRPMRDKGTAERNQSDVWVHMREKRY